MRNKFDNIRCQSNKLHKRIIREEEAKMAE